jgi:hypothetical protein
VPDLGNWSGRGRWVAGAAVCATALACCLSNCRARLPRATVVTGLLGRRDRPRPARRLRCARNSGVSLSLSGSLLHNCQRVDGPGRCSELAAGQTEMGVRGTTWPTATGGSIPLHRRAVRTAQPVDPPRFIFLPSFLVRVLCSHEDFFPACAGQPNNILAHSDFTAK